MLLFLPNLLALGLSPSFAVVPEGNTAPPLVVEHRVLVQIPQIFVLDDHRFTIALHLPNYVIAVKHQTREQCELLERFVDNLSARQLVIREVKNGQLRRVNKSGDVRNAVV